MASPASGDREACLATARQLIKGGAAKDAAALLHELILATERVSGVESSELIEPIYLRARSIAKQHPWNELPAEERDLLERALRLAQMHHGEDAPRTVSIRESLASALHASNQTGDAVEPMGLVVRAKERVHGDGVLLAHAINGLAEMHLQLGHFDEAASLFERSAAMATGKGDALMDFLIWFGYGRALVGLNRTEEAIEVLSRAHAWLVGKYGERNRSTLELRELLDSLRGPRTLEG